MQESILWLSVAILLLVVFVLLHGGKNAATEKLLDDPAGIDAPASVLAGVAETLGELLLGKERSLLRLSTYTLDGNDPNANVAFSLDAPPARVDVDAEELERHGYTTVELRRAVLTAPASSAESTCVTGACEEQGNPT